MVLQMSMNEYIEESGLIEKYCTNDLRSYRYVE